MLLAAALSGPVEALHRRMVPKVVATALIFLVGGALFGLSSYLLLPMLAEQISLIVFSLPAALSQLSSWVEGIESRFGMPLFGETLSPSSQKLRSRG